MTPRRWTSALLLGLVVSPALWAQAPLREGVARYHYYQQNYLSALSELQVAREQEQLDGERGAVLEGAIRLAYGMPETARQRLRGALDDRPEQAAAARFYRGKLHYLRGDWPAARALWSPSDPPLKPALAREQRALDWQARLRAGDRPEIEPDTLWRELGDWAPTVLYNLGGAHARDGDAEAARPYYQSLIEQVPGELETDPEYLALRDRTQTALGFSHLLAEDYDRAVTAFDQVRLDRADSERALLGYGWAALEQGDTATAIRAWQALSERSLTDGAVRESLIALPHAYRELGSPGAALTAYDRAEQKLEAERERLEALSARLTPDYLLAQLETEDEDGALRLGGRENWLTLTDHSVAASSDPYLADWVNRSAFQSRVQALSDLTEQDRLLADWPDKLEHYRQLLRDKRALRVSHRANIERHSLWQRIEQLNRRRTPLVSELARIRQEWDYLALADEDTQALYRRAGRALERLERLEAAGEVDDAAAKRRQLQRYRGLLRWRAAQAFPDNLWAVRKHQRALDRTLIELERRRERIQTIVAEHPDIKPGLARMNALEAQVAEQRRRLERARQTRAEALVQSLNEHLDRHRAQVDRYLARVRLAAARLQDQALREQTGGDS